ncbi:MAG: hypothetical protein Fur0024_2650 [Patescibacteria group bacterium]
MAPKLNEPKINDQFAWQNLWTELPAMISNLLVFVGVLVVLVLIWGGFQYVTAGGSEEKVKAAKKTITNAVIGLVVILLAFAIMQGVKSLVAGQ